MRGSQTRGHHTPVPVATPPGVMPGAEAFMVDGDRVGVLLCHGFTGSPGSMRPFAEHLAAAGRTVALPRLPGHGTVWTDMDETSWPDWYTVAEQHLLDLRRRCDQVFVVGLSMGGALALRLAEQHGEDVSGIVLVNPAVASADRRLLALPVLRRLVRSLPGIANDIARPDAHEHGYTRTPLRALASMLLLWRDVRAGLARVHQPLLLLRSVTDHVVDPGSAEIILAGVSSTEREEVLLHRSYHVATLDHDAPEIFARTVAFIDRHSANAPTSPTAPTSPNAPTSPTALSLSKGTPATHPDPA